MLQEAGLADLPGPKPAEDTQRSTREARHGSDSSETRLGSLDRTKVSLGDSDQTTDSRRFIRSETQLESLDRTKVSLGDSDQNTDSRRFIREQWGTEGTMVKILGGLKARRTPLTVRSLVRAGPSLAGHGAVIAARCFTSILKLKQHGFIRINKDPETLEIRDILLGPKFDQVK
ncbi:uncharacterized protein LOC135072832 [Ostrinia nubilalis]|uniref:uncharacterized protein LOC135072832 n=1 Tax=Ostrinia nubilalis TaxID=29057 RepID=UPI003082206F